MRERSVPCCICRRDTFHDDAVCGRGACIELLAHSKRLLQARLAAKATRRASSDGVASPSSGATPTSAVAAFSKDAPQARGDGISSTGPGDGCSPGWPGPVDSSGSGSTRFPSPDERPQVAPLPSP